MSKYRKPDQYYYDEYDRVTIGELKKLEKRSQSSLFLTDGKYNPSHPVYYHALELASRREKKVREQMQRDERKDYLLNNISPPPNIRCTSCGSIMYCFDHLFKEDDTKILFGFECPQKHLPRRLYYPDGSEYFFPKKICNDCGHELHSLPSRTAGDKLILSDKCSNCGKVYSLEYDDSSIVVEPITEEDRKRYCTYFRGRGTFKQDLLAIGNLIDKYDIFGKKKEQDSATDINLIEVLTVPKLEQRLTKVSEEAGYIKFQFDKPKVGKYLIVEFSTQDPTDRNANESIQLLTKTFKKELFITNWRLMTAGISYNLGFLCGQLKAYQEEDDLKKIAKQMYNGRRNK